MRNVRDVFFGFRYSFSEFCHSEMMKMSNYRGEKIGIKIAFLINRGGKMDMPKNFNELETKCRKNSNKKKLAVVAADSEITLKAVKKHIKRILFFLF